MRNKIVSTALAGVMAISMAVGFGPTANAAPPKPDCSYFVGEPHRVNAKDSGQRMYAMAKSSRPYIEGRNTSVKLWIDLWSPASKKFRRVSLMDYDQDERVALAVVERDIMFGYNRFRAGAEFTCKVEGKTHVYRKFSSTVTLHRDRRDFYAVDVRTGDFLGSGGGWGDPKLNEKERYKNTRWGSAATAGGGTWGGGFGGYGGGGGWGDVPGRGW